VATYAGAATNALNSPMGLFIDGPGNIFIADNANRRIRKVLVNGKIN
jgi:hypothetical protein